MPPPAPVRELAGSGGSSVTGFTLKSDAEQAPVSKIKASIAAMAGVLDIALNLPHLVGLRRLVGPTEKNGDWSPRSTEVVWYYLANHD
jgi:hypothetical protein